MSKAKQYLYRIIPTRPEMLAEGLTPLPISSRVNFGSQFPVERNRTCTTNANDI